MTAPDTPLISVAELAAALGLDGPDAASEGPLGAPGAPAVLDVRWTLTAPLPAGSGPARPSGLDAYLAGCVPGARFVDLDTELAGPVGPGTGRHPLPDPAAFQASMRAAGVRDGRPVVVYDAADSTAAARAWWLLRYFGHPDVRVLDGGFKAWVAAGLLVSQPELISDLASATAGSSSADTLGDFTARPGQAPTLDAAAAGELARTGVLLDARAAARYRGEMEPVDPVAGHIPGAVSAPTLENVIEDGRFRSADELSDRFTGLISKPGSDASPASAEVGVYCGSGVTAAHQVLALAAARIPAALYVGSWSEWITDPSRPVETGPGSSPAAA